MCKPQAIGINPYKNNELFHQKFVNPNHGNGRGRGHGHGHGLNASLPASPLTADSLTRASLELRSCVKAASDLSPDFIIARTSARFTCSPPSARNAGPRLLATVLKAMEKFSAVPTARNVPASPRSKIVPDSPRIDLSPETAPNAFTSTALESLLRPKSRSTS